MVDIADEYEKIVLSKPKYDENSTPEDIEEVKNSVRLVNHDTILKKNPEKPTIFQVKLTFDEIEKLTEDLEFFFIIVSADRIKWPSVKLNRYSRKRYRQLGDKLVHVCIVSGYSPKSNLFLSFLVDVIFRKVSVSFHMNIKRAVNHQNMLKKELYDMGKSDPVKDHIEDDEEISPDN